VSDSFLPYGRHSIDDDDIAAVVKVLKSGALTAGPEVEKFEQAFAKKIGANHAVVCANGTAALHMAVMAAGIKDGDVAIVPAITFLSTANAVRMTGAEVCFADVDPLTGLMTLETLKAAIAQASKHPSAVLPVHMNGQSGDMAAISALARSENMKIITDCCHALGADYTGGGRPGDGQFEDFATFSLHPVKSIAMGEGGVVTTSDDEAARQLRLLRGHAMERDPSHWQDEKMAFDAEGHPNPWYYEMQQLAYNYRATDFQCALGASQLKKLDQFVEKRRLIADWYDEQFSMSVNVAVPIGRSGQCKSAWHLYPVFIDFEGLGMSRSSVMKALQSKGIGTQVHYIPVSDQPYYQARYGKQNLPGAEGYYSQVLSLPIFPAMSEKDVVRVVQELSEVLG
jgi:UDP-4-amino-4,6-dideoxy-N-acetyl-beta-L-altrosamine transaminase